MIPCETNLKEINQTRYRRLAGAFQPSEILLFDGLTRYLRGTGARIATVLEPEGACVWRLRCECETIQQTEARLKRQGHRRPACSSTH